MTIYYISYYGDQPTPQEVHERATVLEANAFASWIMQLGNLGMILDHIVLPAFVVALYVVYRNFILLRMPNQQLAMSFLTNFAIFFFTASLANFANDSAVLLGKLFGG